MRKLKRYHDLKPCPFCSKDEIKFGHDSAMSFAISCPNIKCRAKMVEYLPDRWPPGVFVTGKSWEFNDRRMRLWVAERLVKRWNKRARTQH